jgi:hypothetical protein
VIRYDRERVEVYQVRHEGNWYAEYVTPEAEMGIVIGCHPTWGDAMIAANNWIDNEAERRAGNAG